MADEDPARVPRADAGLSPKRPRTYDPRRLRIVSDPEDPALPPMPATRAECRDGPRPCPVLRCKWHTFLDVTEEGTIKFNFPHLLAADGTPDLDGLAESCVLDVAERGPSTLEEIGALLSLTRERIRQVEVDAMTHLRKRGVRLYGWEP